MARNLLLCTEPQQLTNETGSIPPTPGDTDRQTDVSTDTQTRTHTGICTVVRTHKNTHTFPKDPKKVLARKKRPHTFGQGHENVSPSEVSQTHTHTLL